MSPEQLARLVAHRAELLAFLRRRVGTATAEDLLQTAFVRVLERGLAPRDPARLLGWFYRILRNAAVDHQRTCSRRAELRRTLAPRGAAGPDPSSPAGAATALGTLPPIYRDALRTVYLDGRSLGELAAAQGITRNAAAVRVHRARRALERTLAG